MKINTKISEATAQTHSRNNGTHRTHYTHLITFPKVAFTLAETLITLAIIGVVAAITIPSLVKNYNEHAWTTAQDVFTKRLEVATRQMNTEEKLAGYSNTMDFVNELKNKIKITKICDNNNLTKCFGKSFTSTDGHIIDVDTLKTGAQFTKEAWVTETVGVQFANGINAIIAYNPNTTQEPFNNQFSATANSMAILYDVSGNKNPNIIGKDINSNGNVRSFGCIFDTDLVGGACVIQILSPDTGYSPVTSEECKKMADSGYGNIKSLCESTDSDYWAGAVKACGGTSNMPDQNQLAAIASYIYDHPVSTQETIWNGLTADEEKRAPLTVINTNPVMVWSSSEAPDTANMRSFSESATAWGWWYRSDKLGAICVDNNY